MNSTSFGAAALTIALAAACSRSTNHPAVPEEHAHSGMTPASRVTEPAVSRPIPHESPGTTVESPILVQHGGSTEEIRDAVLLVEENGDRGRLMFFDTSVTCEEATSMRTSPGGSQVLAADVSMSNGRMDFTQPVSWTFYDESRALSIAANPREISLTIEPRTDRIRGTLHVATQVDASNLSADGPIEITKCTESTMPTEVPSEEP